jgi:hypothetical protein
LLFVSNPTDVAVRAALRFRGERQFTSAWGLPRTLSGTDHVELNLRGYEVQIWEA